MEKAPEGTTFGNSDTLLCRDSHIRPDASITDGSEGGRGLKIPDFTPSSFLLPPSFPRSPSSSSHSISGHSHARRNRQTSSNKDIPGISGTQSEDEGFLSR